jgi:hypothetical protein
MGSPHAGWIGTFPPNFERFSKMLSRLHRRAKALKSRAQKIDHRPPLESWPGLSRPSTPCLLNGRKQDVDARDERGHDEENVNRPDRKMG